MTITLRLDRYFLQHLKLLVSWSCQLLLSQHWDCVVLFWVLAQALSSLFDLLKLWCWPPRDVIFGSYILFVCFNISDQLYFSLLVLFIRCKLPLRCNFLSFFGVNVFFFISIIWALQNSSLHFPFHKEPIYMGNNKLENKHETYIRNIYIYF